MRQLGESSCKHQRTAFLKKFERAGVQVIPIDEKGQLQEASNIRIDELNVLDMKFLEATLKPTLVVLYQDSKEARHVKTYEVNIKDKVGSESLPSCQSLL